MHYLDGKLVAGNFDFAFSATVYHNISTGIEAYQRHCIDNKDFYNYNKGKSLNGHLLTYSIERSFFVSAFKPTAGYAAILGSLNEYGYNGLYLLTKNFILNLARTHKKLLLPPKAKYKQKLANLNADIDIQLSLDNLTGAITAEDYNYAFITYGYSRDKLTHLNILVPSAKYDGSLYQNDLLKDITIYKNIIAEDVKEEQIVRLNEELQRKVSTNSAGERDGI